MARLDDEIPQHIQESERPWYRRPELLNRVSQVNTYYRVGLLEIVKDTLIDVVDHELLERFQNGPFGHFIGWT